MRRKSRLRCQVKVADNPYKRNPVARVLGDAAFRQRTTPTKLERLRRNEARKTSNPINAYRNNAFDDMTGTIRNFVVVVSSKGLQVYR